MHEKFGSLLLDLLLHVSRNLITYHYPILRDQLYMRTYLVFIQILLDHVGMELHFILAIREHALDLVDNKLRYQKGPFDMHITGAPTSWIVLMLFVEVVPKKSKNL